MSTTPKAIPPEWIKQRIAFLEMKFPNMKGYTAYIQSLNKESPRGRVLISTGLMEAQLKRILLAFMRDDCKAEELLEGTAGLSSFSSRIAACEALGLISNVECADLSMIRKIRNAFAHDIETSFETPSVVSRCEELKLIANDGAGPEIRFSDSAFILVTRFLKRPEEVALESRKHRHWIDTDATVS